MVLLLVPHRVIVGVECSGRTAIAFAPNHRLTGPRVCVNALAERAAGIPVDGVMAARIAAVLAMHGIGVGVCTNIGAVDHSVAALIGTVAQCRGLKRIAVVVSHALTYTVVGRLAAALAKAVTPDTVIAVTADNHVVPGFNPGVPVGEAYRRVVEAAAGGCDTRSAYLLASRLLPGLDCTTCLAVYGCLLHHLCRDGYRLVCWDLPSPPGYALAACRAECR